MIFFKNLFISIVFLLLGIAISQFFSVESDIAQYKQAFTMTAGLFLAVALFGSVQSVDLDFLKKNRVESILIVSIGVVFKILVFGTVLFLLTGDKVFFLVAAVLSQIDPSFTNWAQRILNIKGDSSKIAIIESAFDDPVSILLALYIILPFILPGGVEFGWYFMLIILNFVFVLIFILEKKRAKIQHQFLSSASVVTGGLLSMFLGVALAGLVFRVKKEIFEEPINIISYLSYFMIGLFVDLGQIQWANGLIIALVLVYFVRPLEILIFFRKYGLKDKLILIFAEQKGLTAILLLLILQPRIDLIQLALPAMLFINAFFFINNYSLRFLKAEDI